MPAVASESFTLSEPPRRYFPPRRRRRDPKPHFKADTTKQLDPLRGCPVDQVPKDDVAWDVVEWVAMLDTSAVEEKYSSQGRLGYHPKHVLGVLLLGSLRGIHHASKLALACKTDAAFRLVAGGHAPSDSVLKRFRREQRELLERCVEQTVQIAAQRKLLDTQQLAVDSVRIQADASTKSVRTLERSKKRLAELKAEDATAMDEAQREVHDAKVSKHEEAVERCEREKRTSHSVTDPHAALMKFPNGAALPGHRMTVTSCGTELRFVVSVLINAAPNDFGMLEEAVRGARAALEKAGMPSGAGAAPMQIAADPGYLSEGDLVFAKENRDWVDVLIHEPPAPSRGKNAAGEQYMGRERFHIHADGSATCPAGRAMQGPYANGPDRRNWRGVDCQACPLKSQCCEGKYRTLTQAPRLDEARDAMRERMARPDAKKRYGKRIATVEPVFSYIEDAMGFRRSSSRKTETVRSEILLKVLAYNLTRLQAAKPVVVVLFSGVWTGEETHILAAWVPRWEASSISTDPTRSGGATPASGLDAASEALLRDAPTITQRAPESLFRPTL